MLLSDDALSNNMTCKSNKVFIQSFASSLDGFRGFHVGLPGFLLVGQKIMATELELIDTEKKMLQLQMLKRNLTIFAINLCCCPEKRLNSICRQTNHSLPYLHYDTLKWHVVWIFFKLRRFDGIATASRWIRESGLSTTDTSWSSVLRGLQDYTATKKIHSQNSG